MTIEITINIPQLEALTEAIRLLGQPVITPNPVLTISGSGLVQAEKPDPTSNAKTTGKGSGKPSLRVVDAKAGDPGKPVVEAGSETAATSQVSAADTAGETTPFSGVVTITDDELRLATAEKAKHNKEAVRDLVKDYADNLTSIAQEHRAEYLERLNKL